MLAISEAMSGIGGTGRSSREGRSNLVTAAVMNGANFSSEKSRPARDKGSKVTQDVGHYIGSGTMFLTHGSYGSGKVMENGVSLEKSGKFKLVWKVMENCRFIWKSLGILQ